MTSLGPMSEILGDRRVVLCLGPGGVGKTTAAAALGLARARAGERVVVLTIDPARRLADALGLGGQLANSPTVVERFPATAATGGRQGELWAAMLDPAETFRQIVEDEATSAEQTQRILTNRLFVNLTTTLSGTNEYMAAERLHQLANDDRFDRVVVDTPPSRHAFDFLDSPGRLTRFVDHRLYRSVLAPQSGLLRPLNTGARLVMRLLAGLVGSDLVDDVASFFGHFETLDRGFRRRAVEIDALLAGPETAYVLVTTPQADRLAEVDWILDNLERRGHHLDAIVANRMSPIDPPDPVEHDPIAGDLPPSLRENLTQLAVLAGQQEGLVTPLVERVGSATPVVRLADQATPVRDLDGLVALSRSLG